METLTPAPARQFAPDLLKAVGIFGVVYIHTIWMVGANYSQYFAWLFRAAVPCFLVMFAYFMERSLSKQQHPWRYIGRRFIHILGIFVIWSLIHSFFKDEWLMPNLLRFMIRHFGGGSWAGQFFFFILLQLIPLFPLLRRLYDIPWLRSTTIAACLLVYSTFGYAYEMIPDFITGLEMRLVVHSLPYVFVGIALARGSFPRIHPAFATAVLLIPVEFQILSMLDMRHDGYVTPVVLVTSSLLAAVTLQSRATSRGGSTLVCIAEYVGGNTMTIFVANPLILGVVNVLTKNLHFAAPGPILEIALAFVFAACAIALCCVLAHIIKLLRLNGIFN